ncbi:MAG: hypothetical protein ACP5H7_00775 [Minisyncoccia bacterium]
MENKQNNKFFYYILIIILFWGVLFFYDIKFRKQKNFEQKSLLPPFQINIDFNILENENIKNFTPLEKPSLSSEKGRENPFLAK